MQEFAILSSLVLMKDKVSPHIPPSSRFPVEKKIVFFDLESYEIVITNYFLLYRSLFRSIFGLTQNETEMETGGVLETGWMGWDGMRWDGMGCGRVGWDKMGFALTFLPHTYH